jgi:hypothetical protein
MNDHTYEIDRYAWSQHQAAALRMKDWSAVDVDHVAEEIAAVGSADENAMDSYGSLLLRHLLKWRHQPTYRTPSWRRTIRQARRRLLRLGRKNPSLRARLPQMLIDLYPDAREDAADETGLPMATFSERGPWSFEQLMDVNFLPEA